MPILILNTLIPIVSFLVGPLSSLLHMSGLCRPLLLLYFQQDWRHCAFYCPLQGQRFIDLITLEILWSTSFLK